MSRFLGKGVDRTCHQLKESKTFVDQWDVVSWSIQQSKSRSAVSRKVKITAIWHIYYCMILCVCTLPLHPLLHPKSKSWLGEAQMRNPGREVLCDLHNESGLNSTGSTPGSQTALKAPRHQLCCLKTPKFLCEFRCANKWGWSMKKVWANKSTNAWQSCLFTLVPLLLVSPWAAQRVCYL